MRRGLQRIAANAGEPGSFENVGILPLSGLRRMAANRVLAENTATAEGRILHEKADSGKADRRGGLQTLRAVQLRSFALGTTGVADVVEKRGDVLTPVEYKRGNLGIIGKVLSSGAVEIKVLGRKVT